MKFPSNFPDHAKAAVIAEQVRAHACTVNELGYIPKNGQPRTIKGYVLRVFYAFAHEACELGRSGTWTVHATSEESREFLRQLCIESRTEFGELGLPPLLGDMGYILPQVWQEFIASDEWKRYQEELLDVAELQKAKDQQISSPASAASVTVRRFPKRAAWLKERLQERSWSKNDLSRLGGPDRKTVQRILDGLNVREDRLEKVIDGLNTHKQATRVGLLDIPSD